MALPAIAASVLTGVAGQTLGSIGALIPTELEKKNRQRLKELERLEEMNALGLTEQERSVVEGKLTQKSAKASELASSERNRLLASGGASSGQALEQAMLGDEQVSRQLTQVQQIVEEQDLAKRRTQTEELRALEAADAEVKAKRISAVAGIASAGLEGGLASAAQQKLLSPGNISATAKTYGIGEDQAKAFLEAQSANPTLAAQMNEYFKSRNKLNDEEVI